MNDPMKALREQTMSVEQKARELLADCLQEFGCDGAGYAVRHKQEGRENLLYPAALRAIARALEQQPEAQASGAVAWRPIATAPRDGTMLRLLVLFTEHATEDDGIAPTIGAWSADGDPDGAWQFAGWCWTHDHFTEGKGDPIGWLPLLDTTPPAPVVPEGSEGSEIVGHKTFGDGRGGFRHEPLTRAEADRLLALCRSEDERRKALMPDERSALRMMMDAYTRLKDLGWNDAVYCPKDGRTFEVIEPGSTGIHSCIYTGDWPTGSWWVFGNGDMYPSRPVLFRPLAAAPAPNKEANRG